MAAAYCRNGVRRATRRQPTPFRDSYREPAVGRQWLKSRAKIDSSFGIYNRITEPWICMLDWDMTNAALKSCVYAPSRVCAVENDRWRAITVWDDSHQAVNSNSECSFRRRTSTALWHFVIVKKLWAKPAQPLWTVSIHNGSACNKVTLAAAGTVTSDAVYIAVVDGFYGINRIPARLIEMSMLI